MPASAFQQPVFSNPTVDFTEALSTNDASANVDLVLSTRDPLWFIRAIAIVSVQDLAWELQFYSSADNLGGTLDTDKFIGVWQFSPLVVGPPASPGYPITPIDVSPADAFYRFYVDGLWIPYYDGDMLGARSVAAGGTYPNNAAVHTRLVNRSATSKIAGASGAVKVTLFLAPQGQQV